MASARITDLLGNPGDPRLAFEQQPRGIGRFQDDSELRIVYLEIIQNRRTKPKMGIQPHIKKEEKHDFT